MTDEERQAARVEYERLKAKKHPYGRPTVMTVDVSEPFRLPGGPGGATMLGCGFCGSALDAMGGPTRASLVCQRCGTAIREPQHPLGQLLRDSWVAALRRLFAQDDEGAAPRG